MKTTGRTLNSSPPKLALPQRLVLLVLALQITLLLPGGLTEVVNFPRSALLIALGCISIYFLPPRIWNTLKRFQLSNIWVLFLIIFLINLWVVVLFSGSDIINQMIGARGRNTGALTYSSLVLTALLVYYNNSDLFMRRMIKINSTLVFFMFLYTLIQYYDLDPMAWNNDAGWIVGTLGNPNFLSSYFGISFTLMLGIVIYQRQETMSFARGYLLWLLPLPLVGIIISESKQGFLIAIIGTVSFLFIYVISRREKLQFFLALLFILIAGLMGLLGVLNKGPLSKFLYEDSVTYRGDYWRAGIAMGLDRPLIGLGIDQYGTNFRSYRDLTTSLRRDGTVTSDSAHNVFLDLFSGGGLPLVLLYFLAVTTTLVTGFQQLRKSLKFDPIKTGIYSAFIAYLAQSIISINQITLALLGWTFLGVISSWNREEYEREPVKVSKKTKSINLIITLLISILFLAPVIRYIQIDSRFISMVKAGNIQGVINLVSPATIDNYYRNFTAASITGGESAFFKEKLLRTSLRVNPYDYNALELLKQLLIESGRRNEAEELRIRQLKIDPYNPSIQNASP